MFGSLVLIDTVGRFSLFKRSKYLEKRSFRRVADVEELLCGTGTIGQQPMMAIFYPSQAS